MLFYQKILLLTAFFLPFSFALSPTANIDLNILKVIIPLIFIFWLASSLLHKKILLDTRPRFLLLITFFFIVTFSFFWTTAPESAFRKILFFSTTIPLYLTFYTAQKSFSFLQKFLKYLFWGAVLESIFALIFFISQFIFGLEPTLNILREYITPIFLGNSLASLVNQYPSWLVNISGKTILRTFGSFPDPHLLSLYLSMILPLGFYFYKKYLHKKYLFFSGIILLTIFFSFSRAAYLSIIFGSLFLFLNSNSLKLIKKNILLIYSLLTIILFLLIIPNPLNNRFQSSFDFQEGSNSGRIEMWQTALEIIKKNPSLGLGLGGFSNKLDSSLGVRSPIYAHNLLLDFGAETGMLNMLILLTIILSPIIIYIFFNKTKKTSSLQKFIATSFVIFFIHSLFETPFFSIRIFPLFLILLSLEYKKFQHNPHAQNTLV